MSPNKLSLLLVCILMSVTSAVAQTQPNLENGYTAYGSYDGSNIDTVNLKNGNLMLHIPLPFSYPQRGGRLTSTNVLSVSSKGWSIKTDVASTGQVSYHWTLGGFGPAVNIGMIGTGVGFANTMDLAVHRTVTRQVDSFGSTTSYSSYYLTTWDGSTHKLTETGPADSDGNVSLFDAGDASGYRVNLNAVCSANGQIGCGVVIDRNGDRYEFSSWREVCGKWVQDNGLNGSTSTQVCQGASIIGRTIDANGNLIDSQDTMGRMRSGLTPAQPSDTSGCVAPDPSTPIASATIQTYQGYNGVTNQIKVCRANITLQTSFGVSGVTEFQNSSEGNPTTGHPGLSAIVTVLLLDGDTWDHSSRWTFAYDSYGNVTRLGLPMGGSITYGWSVFYPNSNCAGISKATRVVSSRTISDNNGHTFRWTYGYAAPTALGASFANSVTDPLNNDTLHYFYAQDNACTYYEQTTQYFQGAANSGTPKKQIDMTYARPVGTAETYVPITIKTTMDNGRVSQVTKTYDSGPGSGRPSFGNVLTESAYDFGFWAPGPLVREVDTTYQWQADTTGAYETAHLLDIPASVVTKDAGGCPVAETDYAYDEGGDAALRASGIADTQHHIAAPTPNIRGNATSVTRWLITSGTCGAKSSSITSKATLYDTGVLYQAIDPLNHASTHYFDPAYLGAYATKTCDALNHCVSGTYDLTTGLLTSFTNQNGTMAVGNTQGDAAHTTVYSYDSFSRIKVASMPDGGQVSFNYSLPNTFPVNAEKIKKINASLDDHSFAYLDGLGRPFKAVHRTPQGDVTVLSTYDGLDHTINMTNPYLSTSDPTYGVIQTQYDALGQPTQTTKQDGSTVMALYNQNASVSNGNCTITTDEAGKQRRSCVDGLARLIEVDEPNPNAAATSATGSLNVKGGEQTAMASTTIAVAGSGFESPFMGTGSSAFQYHPVGSNWSFSSNSGFDGNGVVVGGAGLTGNNSGFTSANPAAPEGVQVAFLQGGSANFLSQTLSGFQAGGSYVVTFQAAQRGNFNAGGQDFDVYLDATLLGTFRPASTNYATLSTPAFTTTTGTHTLKFVGRDSAGGNGNTAFIDAVQISGTAPISDSGTVSMTVNGGTAYTYSYGANDTTGTIVNGLVNKIMADGAALVTATATVNNDVVVTGSGFESPFIGTGSGAFQYHPAGGNWSFSSNNGLSNGVFVGGAGVTGNGTGFTNLNPAAPEGLQVAFLQGGSANFFSQSLSGFQAGGSYSVSFKAAQRGSNAQDFDVYLDSTLLGTFRPAGSSYTTLSTNAFSTTAGTHTLKFVGRDSAGGDNTAFIDAVRVVAVAGSTINLTSKAKGTAVNSYTLTATTKSSFTNPSFSTSTSAFNGGKDADALNNNPYVTLYSYDAAGNLLRVNQNGDGTAPRIRTFTYDSLSRLLTATNPETGTISYRYDNAGNVLQKTSPAANQTGSTVTTLSVCYDALNRPTGKAYSAQTCQNGQLPAGTAAITYSYDAGTNGLGQLSGVIDQAGSASYTYDALGRLTTEQRTTNGISKSVSYDYNLDSSPKAIHYPSGAVVTYTPDAAGRIVSVTDSLAGINYVTSATYGPDNSITGFVNGNNGTFTGIVNAFTYNKRLQPVNLSATTPSQQKVFAIGYDFHVGNGTSGSDNGNVWGVTNFKDSNRSESFTYDALNRLASAQTAGTDCTATLVDGHTKNWGDSYAYDAWGNLLSKTPTKCGGENIAGTMNTKNQPLGYTVGGNSTFNYTFDAAGNLRNDGVLTYNYDAENRLTGANGFTYTYDAGGHRVKKSNGTTGTIYWYAAVGVIAETDLAGNNAKEYIFFNGTRVARKDSNGQIFYYFADHLKTTSVITDSVGNIKSESDFDPWGVERRVVDTFNNTYKFTGKERDAETGFDYFGARYYGSNIGRFVTPDWAAKAVAVPYAFFGNPQSLNLYSYVNNNPTSLGDPDGHADDKAKHAPQVSTTTTTNSDGTTTKTTTRTDAPVTRQQNVGTACHPVWQSVTVTTGTVTTETTDRDGNTVSSRSEAHQFVDIEYAQDGTVTDTKHFEGPQTPLDHPAPPSLGNQPAGDLVRLTATGIAARVDPKGAPIHAIGEIIAEQMDEKGTTLTGFALWSYRADPNTWAGYALGKFSDLVLGDGGKPWTFDDAVNATCEFYHHED